jgi:GT2 family glycosyltransferase
MSVERQRIDKARNVMALETLKSSCDYLLMVDDDNPIPPDTLEKLLEDDKDIVSAVILSRNKNEEGENTICAFYEDKHEFEEEKITLYKPVKRFREEGFLHKVDATGTGAILIKRNVLEKLREEYGFYIFEFGDIKFKEKRMINGKEYDRRTMSEDVEFCERARKAGFEVWLDERVRPAHLTSFGSVIYEKQS